MFNLQQVIYIEIKHNHIVLSNIQHNLQTEVTGNFSNGRLAIAHFKDSENILKDALKKVLKKGLLQSLTLVMHQQVLNDGGLSEVEERILLELGYGLGARKVYIWQGDVLNAEQFDQQVYVTA